MNNKTFLEEKEKLKEINNKVLEEEKLIEEELRKSDMNYTMEDIAKGEVLLTRVKKLENIKKIKNVPYFARMDFKEENRDLEDYSLILYIVKKDDTLWKIAKKFSSTIDDIVRVNGIENPDKIEIGQKLFIPKYVKNSGKSNAESNIIMNYV